jgi:hypothetical protein
MSGDDLDRLMAEWLDEQARSGKPVSGLDRVLDDTRRRKPRPAWLAAPRSRWVGDVPEGAMPWPGSVTFPSATSSRVLLLALVAIALAGAAVLAAGRLLHPAPLGATAQLAYLGADGLYLADSDGRNAKLVDGPSLDPATCAIGPGEGGLWSPDGRHLAVHVVEGGSADCSEVNRIHVLDADGDLVASYPAGTGWRIAWSPDGSKLAAWSAFGQTVEIHGTDGTLLSTLTMPTGFALRGDWDPAWSPDGTSINVSIYRVPFDGSDSSVRVTDATTGRPMSVSVSARSADGHVFAFFGTASQLLFVAQSSDLRARRLDLTPTVSFALMRQLFMSPAGDLVLATTMRDVTYDADGNRAGATWEMVVVDTATGQVRPLVTRTDDVAVRPLGFSPDGRRVLYSMDDDEPSLWSVKTDGSDAQRLVTGARWAAWQPSTP